MLRITQKPSEGGTLLRLEGKLLAPWVHELEQSLLAHSVQSPILLDLAALSFSDQTGLRCLRKALEQGVQLAACSGYLQTLLGSDRTCQL